MDVSENRETLVTFQSADGAPIRATPVRVERHTVVFEVYSPSATLHMSESLINFEIIAGDRPVYSGRGVVKNLITTGTLCVVEASLEDGWLDVDLASRDWGVRLRCGYEDFMAGLRKSFKILPEFKVVIADMQMVLMDLRQWLEQVEIAIRSSPSGDRVKLEQDAGSELGAATTSTLTSLFEKFENVAQQVEDELAPAHMAFARRQLHPLLLCSPFLYRCYSKPLGYAGDYEMVNMILRDPLEGGSLFAKLVNLWFLSQPPAEAHRNRMQYLSSKLLEETARVTREGRTARVFNVGCGPAGEVQSFLRQEICDRTDFSLLDFNEETLQHGRSVLESIKQRNGRRTGLSFVKKSVHQMLKEAGKSVERSADRLYDLVYCAGLLDYLADPVSKRLLSILYEYVAPGGLLITTNVDNSNPRRLTMEYVMDWNLIYRSGAGLESLRPDQAPRECARMISDLTGINLYYEMRKPSRV
jgi:extracellular factor (EF) 3-hydroxypalmitic acid methyl ester biosynthesis protein